MKSCWELKGCPASHYIECPAYGRQASCWEIKQGCLCRSGVGCDGCSIYTKHLEDLQAGV